MRLFNYVNRKPSDDCKVLPFVLDYIIRFLVVVSVTNQCLYAQMTDDKSSLLIAVAQYPIKGNQSVDSILNKCEDFLKESKAKSAHLVVFPELVTLDAWPVGQDGLKDTEILRDISTKVSPKYFSGLKSLAKRYDVMILAGSSPRLIKEQTFNTSVLYFPDGKQLIQNKINLTAWERKVGFSAGSQLNIGHTKWGNFAILVCYDSEFPDLSSSLSAEHPTVIFVPSMTESQNGFERVRWSAQARSVEQHAFVVVSSTVGRTSPTWQHYGQSAIITPRSPAFPVATITGKKNERDLVFANLDFAKLSSSRKKTEYYPARDALKRETPYCINRIELRPATSDQSCLPCDVLQRK